MIILFVLILLGLQAGVESTCEQLCPSDKPYCSDVGCIFECPEPFYINGSNCVSHCGDWFVDENRNCVEYCPSNTFYEEKLQQVQNGQYLERKCVKCNNNNQFIFNGSCVKVCPADSRYIDRNNCVNNCPADKPFKTNITLFDLPHHQCVEKCPNLVDDNFCSDDCQNNKVIFNSTCIGQCPSSSPFLFSKSCLTDCPRHAPSAGHENKTCLKNNCPDERPYVLNNTCTESCPETDPLVFSTFNGSIGFIYCVENCGYSQFRLDDNCVDKCPLLTVAFNDSCKNQCPTHLPFSCVISKGLACGERPKNDITYAVCVDECPSTMLIWKRTCVFSCPIGVPVFENECVDKCPLDYPYQRNITTPKDCYSYYSYQECWELEIVPTCVKDCSSNSYIFNNTCYSYCQSPLLHNDNKCVYQCPATKPLILNSQLALTIWSNNRYSYDYRKYRKIQQYLAIKRCTSSCDEMVIWNSTCVKSCPEGFFIHNGTCLQQTCGKQYSENTSLGRVCRNKCKPHQFVFNRTCIETCPDIYKHFNGTCVEQCPKSHLFTSSSIQGKTCDQRENCFAQNVLMKYCVEMCPNGFFVYKNTCVNVCRKPLFTFDINCVESCPIGSPYSETSSISLENWNLEDNRFRKTDYTERIVNCVTVCTEGKVLLGSKCVNNCPAHLRFIRNETCGSESCTEKYKFFSLTGIRCFDECPKDLFVFNDTCVLQCPDNLFIHGHHCITVCPPTHKLVYETTVGKHENICTDGYKRYNGYMCAQDVKHIKICEERCSENKFLYKNTCLNFCSSSTYIFNRTCVETCPMSLPFVQPATIMTKTWTKWFSWHLTDVNHKMKKCVSKCPDTYPLKIGYDCYYRCPETAPFAVNTKCVKKCPVDKFLDDKTNSCVDKCASDRGLINKTCHFYCPSNVRYIHNSHCVSECPSSEPVALDGNRFICQKSCPDDKLYKDGKCIYRFECDDPMFAYGVLCISSCPEGFVWFVGCKNKLAAIIAILVLSSVLVMLLACSWNNCLNFYRVSKLAFISQVKLKELEKQQREQYLKTANKRNKKDDEISLMGFKTEDDVIYFRDIHNIADSDAVASETLL